MKMNMRKPKKKRKKARKQAMMSKTMKSCGV